MNKFNVGDRVTVINGGTAEANLRNAGLIGTISESHCYYGTSGTEYVVEFDYYELVGLDPKVSRSDSNMFGVWDCNMFDNRRGKYIPEGWLELAYNLPDIEPNVDFISVMLGDK